MAIDTLDYAQKLEAAGVDRKQAEAHAKALRDAVAADLATKADLEALSSRFETMLWKHTAALVLSNLAVAGLLLRFLK